MNMYFTNILIDYDNMVSTPEYIESFIDHLIQRLFDDGDLSFCDNFNIRLYGGWDELADAETGIPTSTLSNRAQHLSAILQRQFPKQIQGKRITVELSRSLAAHPAVPFLFTFRKRNPLSRIVICKEEDCCCESAKPSIQYIRKLHKKNRCPECQTSATSIVWSTEQKLVDVMLATDMHHYATHEPDASLVVVSDDDDFIPAMFYLGFNNKPVLHVYKRPGKCYRIYQLIAPRHSYRSISFMRG